MFTVCGGLGSTSNPTLSQLSANERDAKSFKEERRVFRSMKEREELQIREWIRRTVVGTRRTRDDNMQKSGKTEYLKSKHRKWTFETAKHMSKRAVVLRAWLQILALPLTGTW